MVEKGPGHGGPDELDMSHLEKMFDGGYVYHPDEEATLPPGAEEQILKAAQNGDTAALALLLQEWFPPASDQDDNESESSTPILDGASPEELNNGAHFWEY